MKKIKNILNVYYDWPETHENSEHIDKQPNKAELLKNIPDNGKPKDTVPSKIKNLQERVKIYEQKVNKMEDSNDKKDLQKKLKFVEKFINEQQLQTKTVTEVLSKKDPQSPDWKKFVDYLKELNSKFWEAKEWEKKWAEIPKEELDKLKTMTNKDFLKYSPEERLKYITKNHVEAKNVKEWTDLTFTFTFDWQFNRELYRKTTAWQVLPSNVNNVKIGNTEYKRHWIKWEFFTDQNQRLIIKEWTQIKIWKELSKEELEKIENKNEMIYKAYMWELKPENITDEKLKKEFFDKDGKLLEKYKLTEEEKKAFQENPDIVKEAIARNIEPKFAVLVFSQAVKWKGPATMDRVTTVEDMFTEFDRQRPHIKMWNGELLPNGKYPDELAVRLAKICWWDKWEDSLKKYGIDENKIKATSKQIISSENPNVNLDNVDDTKIRKMLDYALSLTKKWTAGIIWAKHCTDWVSRVWARTLWIDNADAWRTIYNSIRSLWGGRLTWTDAPESVKHSIKPWDYVVLEFSPGHTHWVIALWPVKNNAINTVSYPNWGKSPRVHEYKNPKIIRVKRA